MNPAFGSSNADISLEHSGDDARSSGSVKAVSAEEPSGSYEMSGIGAEPQSGASASDGAQIAPHETVGALMGDVSADDSARRKLHDAYRDRIDELRGYGVEEGVELRVESLEDFWRYVHAEPKNREGDVYLGHDGNLSMAWRDGKVTYVEIEFLGSGKLLCGIYCKSGEPSEIKCVSETLTFAGFGRLIDDSGFRALVSHDS